MSWGLVMGEFLDIYNIFSSKQEKLLQGSHGFLYLFIAERFLNTALTLGSEFTESLVWPQM